MLKEENRLHNLELSLIQKEKYNKELKNVNDEKIILKSSKESLVLLNKNKIVENILIDKKNNLKLYVKVFNNVY